ncbi:hypothetical protein EA770_13625 [Acinetobacter baumannii]|nr:hypothetical protein F7P77_00940 [Acinetobacter courvalinii]RSN80669.1 hypothetical protein EA770_13625 [Acinetobacter baumannii]
MVTLASRLDTTCYVLFGYSYRKISEAFLCAQTAHMLYDIHLESSTTREIRHDPRWQCHYRPNACGRNCRIPL